jgi:hypothetical protein
MLDKKFIIPPISPNATKIIKIYSKFPKTRFLPPHRRFALRCAPHNETQGAPLRFADYAKPLAESRLSEADYADFNHQDTKYFCFKSFHHEVKEESRSIFRR